MAQQLLTRHGVVTRETVASEAVAGGFSAVYQVLQGDGGSRAHPARLLRRRPRRRAVRACRAALDLLRSLRDAARRAATVVLAATDPANPYGASSSGRTRRRLGRHGRGADANRGRARHPRRRHRRRHICGAASASCCCSCPTPSRAVAGRPRGGAHAAPPGGGREEGRRGMLIAEINGATGGHAPGGAAVHRRRIRGDSHGTAGAPRCAAWHIAPIARVEAARHLELRPDATPVAAARFALRHVTLDPSHARREPSRGETLRERIRRADERGSAPIRLRRPRPGGRTRRGSNPTHNRGYDEAGERGTAVRANSEDLGDVDPDSAESENSIATTS